MGRGHLVLGAAPMCPQSEITYFDFFIWALIRSAHKMKLKLWQIFNLVFGTSRLTGQINMCLSECRPARVFWALKINILAGKSTREPSGQQKMQFGLESPPAGVSRAYKNVISIGSRPAGTFGAKHFSKLPDSRPAGTDWKQCSLSDNKIINFAVRSTHNDLSAYFVVTSGNE